MNGETPRAKKEEGKLDFRAISFPARPFSPLDPPRERDASSNLFIFAGKVSGKANSRWENTAGYRWFGKNLPHRPRISSHSRGVPKTSRQQGWRERES